MKTRNLCHKILRLCVIFWFFGVVTNAMADGCPEGYFWSSASEKCLPPVDSELTDQFSRPMTFVSRQISLARWNTWVSAEGVITPDTPSVFRKFLKSYDAGIVDRIEFHSLGGNLMAALELGRMIRNNGYKVNIGHTITLNNPEYTMDVVEFDDAVCMSACAYTFLGGVTRRFYSNKAYGVHRFGYSLGDGDEVSAQIAASEIAKYVEEMGVDQNILRLASRADFNDDMFFVPVELAKQLRIIFDPSESALEFRIELYKGAIVANTGFFHKDRYYNLRIHCIENGLKIVIWSDKLSFPFIYLKLNRNIAIFNTSNGEVYVPVTSGVFDNGIAYMVFDGIKLMRYIENDGALSLSYISPPQEQVDDMDISDKIVWFDASINFGFSLEFKNAKGTLPILMRECS